MHVLEVFAGPTALRHLQAHGLRAEDIAAIPAAAGGPKGLILNPLDRYIFGEWLPRSSHGRAEGMITVAAREGHDINLTEPAPALGLTGLALKPEGLYREEPSAPALDGGGARSDGNGFSPVNATASPGGGHPRFGCPEIRVGSARALIETRGCRWPENPVTSKRPSCSRRI